MNPHKRSVTIELMDGDEHVLGGGRFATGTAGYRSMLDTRWFGQVTSRTCQGQASPHPSSRVLTHKGAICMPQEVRYADFIL